MVYMSELARVPVDGAELVFNLIPSTGNENGLLLCTEYRGDKDTTVSISFYEGTLEDQIRSCLKTYNKN